MVGERRRLLRRRIRQHPACLDAETGAPLWDSGSTINGPILAAPTVVDGRVFVSTWDGHVYAFGP